MSEELIWLITGIFFIFIEFFIPNFVIAFFGGGALVTSLITLIFHPPIPVQLIVFMSSSILLLVFLRRYFKKTFIGSTIQDNGETTSFNIEIGKILPVTELIEPGEVGGKVRYQGTVWEAKSDTRINPGESVKLIGCDNITLIVKKINNMEE